MDLTRFRFFLSGLLFFFGTVDFLGAFLLASGGTTLSFFSSGWLSMASVGADGAGVSVRVHESGKAIRKSKA